MDEMLWTLIESERAADEAGEAMTEEDLQPVGIADGGRVVWPDGSYVLADGPMGAWALDKLVGADGDG